MYLVVEKIGMKFIKVRDLLRSLVKGLSHLQTHNKHDIVVDNYWISVLSRWILVVATSLL